MNFKKLIALICAMCITLPYGNVVRAEEKFKAYVLDDFEFKDSRNNWWLQTTKDQLLSLTAEHAKSGSRALKYKYSNREKFELPIISTEWEKGGTLVKNSEKYNYMGFWVYGNAEDLQVAVDIRDGNNAKIRYGSTPIDFEGWKYIEYKLSGVAPDLRVYEFVIIKTGASDKTTGVLYFDDLTFSENSYYQTEGNGGQMAGMHGVEGTGNSNEGSPTLREVNVSPVLDDVPQISQLNNENPLMQIRYKNSKDLPDSISGVAAGDTGALLTIKPGTRGVTWASGWLNDGENVTTGTFSSGMHSSAAANEWVMLTFEDVEKIHSINLLPRDVSGICFPKDYHIELSVDGENWEKVVDVKDFQYNDKDFGAVVHEFEPTDAKYLKLTATKLTHDGNPSTYYLQIREIEAFDANGNNVAVYTNGTTAIAGNPLTTNAVVDYEECFSNIFESGVKWINIINVNFWDKTNLYSYEKENIRKLKENGVNITYRFPKEVPNVPKEEAELYADEFISKIEGRVTELKDYIDVWQIANEDNFTGRPYTNQKPEAYALVVGKVADRIRELDPGCKIEIETALIDFGWTEKIMEAGLAGKIDIMGIHVYKEVYGSDNMIEENGTFIKDGVRHFPEDQPHKNYQEEIEEYTKLLKKYNPDCEVWCTETSINRGNNPYCVSELVQAKWLLREYVYHQMLGVGPTCWWPLDMQKTNEIEWGLMDEYGKRLAGWYALRNVANTMNNDYSATKEISAEFSNSQDMIYECYKKENGTYQIPYWVKTKMRTENTGRLTDITLTGVEVKNAVCVDLLSGSVQQLKFEKDGDKVIFKDMIARDYPMVIRINSDEEYDEYKYDASGVPEEKPLWEKIISGSVILNAGKSTGIIRGNQTSLRTDSGVVIIDDTSYVPVRFLSEAFGKKVYWLDGMIVISDREYEIDEETKSKLKEYYEEKEAMN